MTSGCQGVFPAPRTKLPFFVKNGIRKDKGLNLGPRGGETCWVPPPPPPGCCLSTTCLYNLSSFWRVYLRIFLFLVLQVFQADLFQKMNLKPDVSEKRFTMAIWTLGIKQSWTLQYFYYYYYLRKNRAVIYYLHLSGVALFIMIVSCYGDNKKTERTMS